MKKPKSARVASIRPLDTDKLRTVQGGSDDWETPIAVRRGGGSVTPADDWETRI